MLRKRECAGAQYETAASTCFTSRYQTSGTSNSVGVDSAPAQERDTHFSHDRKNPQTCFQCLHSPGHIKQYMINVQFYFLPLVLPFPKLPCNPLLTSSGCCEPLHSHLISAFTNETPSNKEKTHSPSIFGDYIISVRSTTSRSPLSSIPYLIPTIFQFLPKYSPGMSKRWHKGAPSAISRPPAVSVS